MFSPSTSNAALQIFKSLNQSTGSCKTTAFHFRVPLLKDPISNLVLEIYFVRFFLYLHQHISYQDFTFLVPNITTSIANIQLTKLHKPGTPGWPTILGCDSQTSNSSTCLDFISNHCQTITVLYTGCKNFSANPSKFCWSLSQYIVAQLIFKSSTETLSLYHSEI